MRNFFFYGTLVDNDRFRSVTGSDLANHQVLPATLTGFSLHRVKGAGFPAVVPAPGEECKGVIVTDINDEQVARLDRYEGVPSLYTRQTTTQTGLATDVYVWAGSREDLGEQLESWKR